MKRFSMLLVVAGLFLAPAQANTNPNLDAQAWQRYSDALVVALQSDKADFQQEALRHIIRYGDKLNMDAAVFDIVRLYRDHEDTRIRRMAVLALAQMDNAWGRDFLQRSLRFEQDATVRQTMRSALAA